MSLATYDTTHVADGTANLLNLFKTKPNFVALLGVYLAEVQDLEDALWTLATQRALNQNTVGAQLDGIGQIIGIARNGLGDSAYLQQMQVQITLNQSSGLINDVLNIVSAYFGGTNTVQMLPSWPAQFIINIGNALANASQLVSLVGSAKPAGVGGLVVYQGPSTNNNQVFRLDTAGQGLDQGKLSTGVYA